MNTPDDLNSIAKMVNDTIRQRDKQKHNSPSSTSTMPGMMVVFNGNSLMVVPILCNECGKSPEQINDHCTCGCHPKGQKA